MATVRPVGHPPGKEVVVANDKDLMAPLVTIVKEHVRNVMQSLPPLELLNADDAECFIREAVAELSSAIAAVWAEEATALALELAGACPGCGADRKVHQRPSMTVKMLGVEVEVPKPYLDCSACDAPGISVMRVLTGLGNGTCSAELELMTGYLGSQMTYGKASRDIAVHHQVEVERTAARRLSLRVEAEAVRFAESERADALAEVGRAGHQEGVPCLMLQGDGGTVRVGELRSTTPADAHHGELTATGRVCRAKDVSYREVITFDVRAPGSTTEMCMDILVPNGAPEGERSRRMLALAQRAGLGDDTQVRGLGDMGSSLATSFDEAFFAYDATYSADWKHTSDYVDTAAKYLTHKAPEDWVSRMKDALWERNHPRARRLIDSARRRRIEKLPSHLDKCPVEALATYVENNWERFHARAFREAGLEFVSARAESQVRDRTKDRFSVAGAWRPENLDGKATLRAIIADGRWKPFREHYLRSKRHAFTDATRNRVHNAVEERRLAPACLRRLGLDETTARAASAA
jgi:hypothetical protein